MTAEDWSLVKQLFEAVRHMSASERSTYLSEACPSAEARAEIESLVAVYADDTDFLESPALSSPRDDSEPVPARVGCYEISRRIGQGGMGVVYEAYRSDGQFQQRVAIKVLKRGMDSEALLQRFRNERQILAFFQHPHIARLFDGGALPDGRPFFAMEFIDGEPITEFCATRKIDVPGRLRLVLQVCSAVEAAHRNLIVHRDIKPSNILVVGEGECKLLDFGIAKIIAPGQDEKFAPTIAADRLLTPDYASPEQIRGEPITTASDIYSLGALLYELLTGRPPYQFASRQIELILKTLEKEQITRPSLAISRASDEEMQIASERSTTPSKLRRVLQGDLDNIVFQALRTAPERRYGSVEQFADDLRRYFAGLPVAAQADTFRYRTSKFIRRHKTGVIAAAVLFVALVAAVVITTRQARIAERERARAETNFQDVRALANSLVFDLDDAIKDLPGSTAARKILVDKALQYLARLSEHASGNGALQKELATAYRKLGDIQGDPVFANMGKPAGALQSYRKAQMLLEPLAKTGSADSATLRDLSDVYFSMIDLLDAEGDYKQALMIVRKLLPIDQKLAAQSPDAHSLNELAGAYNSLGLQLLESGDPPQALESYRKAASTRLSIKQADAARLRRIHLNLAGDYVQMGQIFMFQGRISDALAIHAQAVDLLREVAAAEPQNATFQSFLGEAYCYFGDVYEAAGNPGAAIRQYLQARVIFQKLVAADASNELANRYLAFTYQETGQALVESGLPARGMSDLSQALVRFQSIPGGESSDYVLSGLADTYFGFGLAKSTLKQWNEARSWYEKSLAIWIRMQARGALAWVDAQKPERIRGKIMECGHHLSHFSH